jgi:molybdate transport system ATP-binding protein
MAIAQGEVGEMSVHPELRAIIGNDAVGSILEGTAQGIDPASGLVRINVGRGELKVQAPEMPAGVRVRVQLLARDIIVATREPQYLSVRNILGGTIATVSDDDLDSKLIAIDIGGASIMARVTAAAARELGLAAGLKVWALVKAVSLRGHSFAAPRVTSRGSRDA